MNKGTNRNDESRDDDGMLAALIKMLETKPSMRRLVDRLGARHADRLAARLAIERATRRRRRGVRVFRPGTAPVASSAPLVAPVSLAPATMGGVAAPPSPPLPAVVAVEAYAPSAQGGLGVRLCALGPCQVVVGTRTLTRDDWPVQKALRIFAQLACRRDTIYDGILMSTYWPESDDERARASLRNALYYVRQVIEAAATESGFDAGLEVWRSRRSRDVGLRGAYEVDAEVFERGIDAAAVAFAQGDVCGARRALESALALYRGPFMDGVDEEWVQAPRARYEDLYLRGTGLLSQCALASGEAQVAETVARRGLQRDEMRETLHVALIEALLAQGRRAEAMRHYQEAAALFEREFGISVPRVLTDLFPRLVA